MWSMVALVDCGARNMPTAPVATAMSHGDRAVVEEIRFPTIGRDQDDEETHADPAAPRPTLNGWERSAQ